MNTEEEEVDEGMQKHSQSVKNGKNECKRLVSASKTSSESAKQVRVEKLDKIRIRMSEVASKEELDPAEVGNGVKKLEKTIVRTQVLATGQRIDGRDTKTVRPISAEVGVLPMAHGSALFTRGETQALVVTTLGTGQDEQIMDALEGE